MKRNETFSRRTGDFLVGKGFYIVLTLCVVVIAISAWAMLNHRVEDSFSMPVIAETQHNAQIPPSLPTFGGGETPPASGPVVEKEEQKEVEESGFFDRDDDDDDEVEEVEEPAETISPPPAEETQTAAEPVELQFIWPVSGELEVPHSLDRLVFNRTMGDWRTHAGVDITAELGEAVLAVAEGTVERIFQDDLLGTTVVIRHANGLESLYANLAELPVVSVGDWVAMGTPIGAVGRTALSKSGIVHVLHIEMFQNGIAVDPLDFLPAR